jgi:hypothetical protein
MNDFAIRRASAAALLMLAVAACKKPTPPASLRPPETATQLPMPAPHTADGAAPSKKLADSDSEMEKLLDKKYAGKPAEKEAVKNEMRALDALGEAEEKLAAINQRTMVIPAPADFRPEPVARKVRLNLVLEKSKIRAGENPRFRLELTNVGRETINYQEYQSSIFRWGSILHSMRTIRFYLIDEKGKRLKLHPELGTGRAEPIHYHAATPDSEKEMREINALGQASTTFRVKLRPGDTLRSLGDGDSAQEPFRTLFVEGGFNKSSTYQLKVELDDRPAPLNDHYIKFALRHSTLDEIKKTQEQQMKEALGPVSSAATLEVVR